MRGEGMRAIVSNWGLAGEEGSMFTSVPGATLAHGCLGSRAWRTQVAGRGGATPNHGAYAKHM